MGGKPFTSRGCHICRRRKVKCDEQKPQCATCLRRGVECPGYERENGVFIHHKNDRDPSSKPVKKPTLKLVQSHHPPSNLQISTKPLGQHAVRDQIFASFYAMYFPKNGYVSRVNPWQFLVANFKSIAQKSPMLEKAVFAVASLYVGKVKDDLRVSNNGQRVYNEAIWLLRNKIQAGSYDSDIIYTTYVFQEIEQFHISLRHEAYFAHLDGMKRILNYYSTRVVNDPFANRIHTNQPRFTMYLAATGVKQPVGKYEAVPPATGFDLYDQFLELLDAVISFAGVLASAMDSETCNQETRNSILDGCVELEAKWTGWFTQSGLDESYTYALPNEIFTSKLSATDSLFGRAYQFDTHDSAILYAWSFECMIRVMKLTHKARAYSLSEEGTAPSGELDSEGLRKLEFYADKICLAIPFCAHDDMGPSGLHSPMLPICTAALAYVDLGQREKFSWCQQALQVGADRHISTATFFKEICGERFKESGLDCNSQDVSVSTKENNEHCQKERVVDVSEEA